MQGIPGANVRRKHEPAQPWKCATTALPLQRHAHAKGPLPQRRAPAAFPNHPMTSPPLNVIDPRATARYSRRLARHYRMPRH